MDQLALQPQPSEPKQPETAAARARRLLKAITPQQRIALVASALLVISEILPWYSGGLGISGISYSDSRTGLGAFSLVELAILLTAASVIALIYLRVEGHKFRLPLSDSLLITGAGGWSALLVIYRMFERPHVNIKDATLDLGLSWGIFVALVAAVVLALAGLKMEGIKDVEHR